MKSLSFTENSHSNEPFEESKWISYSNGYLNPLISKIAPCLRKEFMLENKVEKATITICGLGLYQLFINGERPNDNVLMPLFSNYDKRVLYDVIDVTHCINYGKNCVGIILGNGFYFQECEDAWDYKKASWRSIPKVILEMDIIFIDGSKKKIVSDESFKVFESAIVFNCIRNGEYYDARLYQNGWSSIGFDDANWKNAVIIKPPGGILCKNTAPPIKMIKKLEAVNSHKLENGRVVYDFGQNTSGFLQLSGYAKEGTELIFRYGEKLDENKNLDTTNVNTLVMSGEFQTDKYIFGNYKAENWSPCFIYHGFRYIEVQFSEVADIDLQAVVVHSDLRRISSFECSNSLFNKLDKSLEWSDLSNFVGIPIDCPQREKNGWLSEGFISSERILFNYNSKDAYVKWLDDFKDAQLPSGDLPGIIPTPGWGYFWGNGSAYDYAIIGVTWNVYIETGDIKVIEKMYGNIKLYMKYHEYFLRDNVADYGLYDWLSVELNNVCPTVVSSTSYYYSACTIFIKMAQLLCDDKSVDRYTGIAKIIKKSFNEKYVDTATGKVGNGNQTAQAVSLYYGIVNENVKNLVVEQLCRAIAEKDGHISCGTFGTRCILDVLSRNGKFDIAYEMVNKKTYPGWGYMIEKGATTLWECWDGENDWAGSLNHNVFGNFAEWFYKYVVGLQQAQDSVGYKKVVFAPSFYNDLDFAKCTHNISNGDIHLSWIKEDNVMKLKLKVPLGSTGELIFPQGYALENGETCVSLSGGDYLFDVSKKSKSE